MTGNLRAPERRRFPVSARESPKLKIESYFGGGLHKTVNGKKKTKRKLMIFILLYN